MGKSKGWHDAFFGSLYQQVLANQFSSAQTKSQLALVRRLLRLRKPMRVLDVPCGMGRLALALAEQGLRMTGVDFNAAYLRRARREAGRRNLDMRFVQADMRRLAFEAEFDAVFNWFGSFGYFSDRDNLRVAECAFAALRPGGRFLVEGLNQSWLRTHLRSSDEWAVGGVRIENRRAWDAKHSRVRDTWTMSKGRQRERHRISIRLFNGSEMRALLRSVGFRDIQLLGGRPIGPLTRHSPRLIAVATRPRGRPGRAVSGR